MTQAIRNQQRESVLAYAAQMKRLVETLERGRPDCEDCIDREGEPICTMNCSGQYLTKQLEEPRP